jgi:hypothetical protein
MCDRDFSCGKTRFFRGADVAVPPGRQKPRARSLMRKKFLGLTLPTRIDRRLLFFVSVKRWFESIFTSSARCDQPVENRQEAVRLVQLPKDAAINSLALTIRKSASERWSPTDASITAASLIEHLPYHLFHQLDLDREHQQQIYDVAGLWDPAIAASSNMQSDSNQPNHTGLGENGN